MSTLSLYTGLSGMIAHARRLDVIGNNIANANTTAFKSSRMLFADRFSWTLDQGTIPAATTGGTNPKQIGLGVDIGATQRSFADGSLQQTGDGRDLAIEGRGLFVVQKDGNQRYTRAGAFRQDQNFNLVTSDGDQLMGYGIDSDFNIQRGGLVPLTAPIGRLSFARATENARLSGNLKADGDVATQGSRNVLGATTQSGFSLIPSATVPAPAPSVLEPRSLLREIADPLATSAPLFQPGQTIELAGIERGKNTVRTSTFTIAANSTMQDLMTFMRDALGLRTGTDNPDGRAPGVSLDPATGRLNIVGNTGTINDLKIDATDIRLRDSSGTFLRNPFVVDKQASATGESVRTTFLAYDSLGAPITMDVGMVLQSRGLSGTEWRYEVDSNSSVDLSSNIDAGTLRFDNLGQLQSNPSVQISLDRAGTGAATPQNVTLSWAASQGSITALASRASRLSSDFQDGAALGTLSSFGVDRDGIVYGSFTNGLTRTLGQVVLANVPNPEGLLDDGANLYRIGANSGPATINEPGRGGTGEIVGGALEQSNVDLNGEFINLIQTSTGYSASSRVIRTADELVQQLLVLGR